MADDAAGRHCRARGTLSAESLDNTQRLMARLDELESELSRVHHALEHHERLATLGTIAGLIAHEFNNILTPVLSYAQMALAAPDDRELVTKALQKAADGAERASQIAGSILGFVRDEGPDVWAKARAAARPAEPNAAPQPVADLRSAAQDAIACMGRDLGRDLIELKMVGEPGVQAAIKPLALQHILLNLILNARAAMLPLGGTLTIETVFANEPPRPGPGAVTTRSTRNIPNTGWAVIRIKDTGRGMRPETLARIFEPFFTTKPAVDQVPGMPSERRRGTGLGMTMCKRLADEVGGYLTVESQVGEGTCVTVVLPAAAPAQQLRKSA